MSSIVKMYDASNNDVYPITHLRAVRDSNGTTLESMIQGVNETTVGYYECTTAGSTPEKTITIDSSVSLSVRISCKVKFAEKNTGANATMNINGTGAKPLFYNGVRAAANNSWYQNEIVDLYFDGTNYQVKSCADILEYDVSLHQTHEITEVTTTTRTVVYNGDVTSGWENETSVSDSSINGYTRTETNIGKDNDATTVDGPTAKYDTASNKTSVVYVTKRTLTHVVNDYTFDEAVNAVPMSYRHGGLKLRFISNNDGSLQNSDNKYAQYRLMANEWSTTVSDWQGVDNEPTAGSNNLVKSGGVAYSINQLKNAGYLYAGIATPTTNPGTPDGPVFYIANGKGTYTNFGGIDVTEDEVVILYYDTVWHKDATGIASNDKLTELDKKTEAIYTEEFESENSIIIGESIDEPTLVIGNKSVNFYGSIQKNGSDIVTDEEIKGFSHLTNNITEEKSENTALPNISITNDDETETYVCIDESGIKSKNFFINNGQIVDVEKALSELNKEVQDVVKIQDIKIQIPDIVYAVEGIELNLWNDTVSLSSDRGLMSPLNYYTKWKCNKGKVTPRGFQFTPTSSDVGEHNCTCTIYNIQNKEIDSKSFVIKVATKDSLTQSKRILFCGDSLGASTAQAIYNNFHSELFAGTIPTMVGNVGNTAKGLYYGGWKWEMFAKKGETMYRLQVSGISSLVVGARYVDNRNGCFEILEVNITGGSGNILMARVYDPSKYDYHELDYASGVLTKAESIYGGDNSFSYTGNQEAGNPLWNEATNKIDVANYRAKIGLTSNEKIDMVIFQLGINDNGWMDEEDNRNAVRNYIRTLYSEFISDNPECIFAIGTPPSHCNTDGGMGANYGATNDAILYAQREYILRSIYLEFDNNKVDYPNLRLLSENLCCDRYYGYPFNEQSISSRYAPTEQVHSNMVHPSGSGYDQLGDSLYASIINLLK